MSAEVEENAFFFLLFPAANGFIDDRSDRVRRFRGRDQALGRREHPRRFKTLQLMERHGFNDSQFRPKTHQWRHPVIAQSAGMNTRWDVAVPEGVHFD